MLLRSGAPKRNLILVARICSHRGCGKLRDWLCAANERDVRGRGRRACGLRPVALVHAWAAVSARYRALTFTGHGLGGVRWEASFPLTGIKGEQGERPRAGVLLRLSVLELEDNCSRTRTRSAVAVRVRRVRLNLDDFKMRRGFTPRRAHVAGIAARVVARLAGWEGGAYWKICIYAR